MIIQNGTFKVYIHTNKTNGKMYVGITKRSLAERWNNGNGYETCSYFFNAIQKYGWDSFEHELFADNLTEAEAMNMEYLLIQKLNLQNRKYGYNLKDGGTHCSIPDETKEKIGNALRGRAYSEEKRKIYSDAHRGKKLSSDHAAAISKANKGRPRTEKELVAAKLNGIRMSGDNHWTRRIGITEETKKKISDSMKKYTSEHKIDGHGLKKVMAIETNIIYKSIEEASKLNNISRSSISECSSGKRKSAGGLHWKFV